MKKTPQVVVAGCVAFDVGSVEQFDVWGVSSEINQVVGKDGTWHALTSCTYVREGTISVQEAIRRSQLFPNVKWDDGRVPIEPQRRHRPMRVMVA